MKFVGMRLSAAQDDKPVGGGGIPTPDHRIQRPGRNGCRGQLQSMPITLITRRKGPYPSKLGREELWELVDLWELSPENKQRIKEMIEHDPHVEGPHLFRYYNPKPSRVAAAEDAMRELIGTKYCLAVNSCT